MQQQNISNSEMYWPSSQQYLFKFDNRTFTGAYMGKTIAGHMYATEKGLLTIPEQAVRNTRASNNLANEVYENAMNSYVTPFVSIKDFEDSIKDKIVEMYKNEFPAIKYITETTASKIDLLNESKGHKLTFRQIVDGYKEFGKKLEENFDPRIAEQYKEFKDIVDDFKYAKHTEMQNQAHENKLAQNQVSKTPAMEMAE